MYVVARDRRRPGRLTDVSPHLIPLLRNPLPKDPAEFEREQVAVEGPVLPKARRDDMAAARGIAVASVLGLAMWIGIVLVVKLLWGL